MLGDLPLVEPEGFGLEEYLDANRALAGLIENQFAGIELILLWHTGVQYIALAGSGKWLSGQWSVVREGERGEGR